MKNLIYILLLLFPAVMARSQAPTAQASNIRFFNISQNYTTIKWIMGNGAKRAVFVKEGTGAITLPSNGTTYTASADWNVKGSQLGTSGYYCVYNGSGYLVTVPGFPVSTIDNPVTVSVYIFEYNGDPGSEAYLTTSGQNNPVVQPVLKQPEDMCEPWCSTCANELCSQPGYRQYLDLTNGLVNGYSTGLPLVSLDFMAYEDGDSPCSFIWKDANCKKTGSNYVTIGINIDLGKQSSTTLTALGVSDSVIAVLTPVLGLKNGNLPTYCAQNNYSKCHVELSPLGRSELNEKFHYAKATELQGIFNNQKNPDVPNFENLPIGVRTSIYSNYFLYGAAMLMKKPFWSLIIKGDWPSAIAWLRDVQTNRADDEAIIMEKALLPPNAVGGNVTAADTVVNCGTNSTLLTLSGYTGSIRKWQFSTNNNAWQDISGATSATYTVVNLAEDSWFRAMIAGAQDSATSTAWKLTVFPKYRISGYARYQNNPLTPLNGLKILLRKGQAVVDSVYTSASGYFAFSNKTNGTFGLMVQSAYPGGQWQTWGGVNNTDALLVLNHINNTLPLPASPPVIRVAASVKTPHPAIQNNDYLAIRQAAKAGWGYFDTTKWVFSGVNTGTRIDTFSLACDNVTRDIRGLCTGDVNGTHVPANGYKISGPDLQLLNQGTLPMTREIVFPVRTDHDLSLGAITLMLDYNPSQIDITGVEMPVNGGVEPWFEKHDGILNIGWFSTDGARVPEGGVLMMIKARLKREMSNEQLAMNNRGETIRFALNESPLSEIADAYGQVLNSLKISIPDASSTPIAHSSLLIAHCSVTAVYPNPVRDLLNLQIMSDAVTTASVGIYDLPGRKVLPLESLCLTPGLNVKTMDLSGLHNGAYLITVTMNDWTECRKVIVNR